MNTHILRFWFKLFYDKLITIRRHIILWYTSLLSVHRNYTCEIIFWISYIKNIQLRYLYKFV